MDAVNDLPPPMQPRSDRPQAASPLKADSEADDMIMAMEEGREVDILEEVMRYSGLEAGPR